MLLSRVKLIRGREHRYETPPLRRLYPAPRAGCVSYAGAKQKSEPFTAGCGWRLALRRIPELLAAGNSADPQLRISCRRPSQYTTGASFDQVSGRTECVAIDEPFAVDHRTR